MFMPKPKIAISYSKNNDLLHMFDAADVEEVSWEATAFAVISGMITVLTQLSSGWGSINQSIDQSPSTAVTIYSVVTLVRW